MKTSPPCNRMIDQVIAVMFQNRPFDSNLASMTVGNPWTLDLVIGILRSIPKFFFQSHRSIGRQKGFRRRSPLKQRNHKEEFKRRHDGVLVLGPSAYRDTHKATLGLGKAMQFYNWIETHFEFDHNEITCREMACLFAKGNDPKGLWDFLKKMSREANGRKFVSTESITCLMKCLGEEGLVNEALSAFYRMKQFHCKPDVYAYNTIIYALCRVGNFRKAKFLLEQMELPGFYCPPDVYTYTILISSFCKSSMQTGCKKAVRRRLWEANHLFSGMLFKGFVPDVVTYNCLIDGCCKTNRIERALELFDDMIKRECKPNRVTYNSFIRYYSAVNEIDKAVEMMTKMKELSHGEPSSSSYTPVIHGLCEAGKAVQARDFLIEMVQGGSVPREYTYKLVTDALERNGEFLDDELQERVREGIEKRSCQVIKIKPVMAWKQIS